MSTLEEKQAEAKAKMQASNPSVAPGKSAAERKRVPLSVPQRKLEVPEIPGYYLRWFRGTASRLLQAQNAGFEFVNSDEVQMNDLALGGDGSKSGNTDLGSRVSVVEGGDSVGGQAVRMYLMKQKLEHRKEDADLVQKRNDSIADALTASYAQGSVGGRVQGETEEDFSNRYVDAKRTRIPDLFNRNKRRGRG